MSSVGKWLRTFAATSLDKRVRESNIVKIIVESASDGFNRFFTRV
jgi:hypothetical protein